MNIPSIEHNLNLFLVSDGKPIMYEKKFLQNIASQNFEVLTPSPDAKSPVKVPKINHY